MSPAPAINAGLTFARGHTVGLMIDGARMLTPGVVAGALAAGRAYGPALVAVPGYQLGPLPHHMAAGRRAADDDRLLDRIGWPADGYRLFEVASMSLANRMGIFRPFMECNCLFAPADVLAAIGGADERFDLPGGGALNLWLWHRLAHWPGLPCVVLPGEGSVHQVHGGVTTSFDAEGYRARTEAFLAQLNAVLGEPFKAPDVPVSYLGAMPQTMAPFVTYSANGSNGQSRGARWRSMRRWPRGPDRARRVGQPRRRARWWRCRWARWRMIVEGRAVTGLAGRDRPGADQRRRDLARDDAVAAAIADRVFGGLHDVQHLDRPSALCL